MRNATKTVTLSAVAGLLLLQPRTADAIFPQKTKTEAAAPAAKKAAKAKGKAKAAGKKGAKKPEKKPKGILGRIFRKIIPKAPPKGVIPKKRKEFHIPVDPKTRAKSLRARDHIDARAPHDPDDFKRLRRAEERAKAGDYKSAVLIIQNLLDRKNDSMIRTEKGEWVSVRQRVNDLMAKLPENFHTFYRVKYGGQARIELADSLKNGDARGLAEVATRYFYTKAGREASRRLAVLALDRGDYGIAARWYARLLGSRHNEADDPLWMLQAAYAFRRTGDNAGAQKLLKEIESKTAGRALAVGGRKIDPRKWLAKVSEEKSTPDQMREWWTLFGNASRTGRAIGGVPLLLSRWSKPTTYSHTVKRKMKAVFQSLRDHNRALIPASIPLAVDGKIVFRTLRGVLVVDAETGDALWESRSGISAEELLSKTSSSSNTYSRFARFRTRSESESTNTDFHPATGLLFRNGNHGMLSSDGKQVFVIEKMALLPNLNQSRYGRSGSPEDNDSYRRSWLTNKLTAYDLKTGRPNWEIGGRRRKESFDLPLAGTFFLGVPVADAGELFVIGEQDNRIRLHVLDAETGKPKWSRLIAYSDTKISKDSVRRWLSAQVAVRNGVIVCPTTVGWMVGVDRTNGAILWGHRYSKPQQGRRHEHGQSTNNLSPKPLNGRWLTSAPVIASGHVVFTPQEEETIVCLRLRDGKQVWKIPKSNYLYLAGTFEGNVVLVGKTAVTAVSLEKGATTWTLKLPKASGVQSQVSVPPSGMGVAVGNDYHLPLHSGELWTIDLTSGAVKSKYYLPKPHGTQPVGLGNLVMYRGQVVSLTPWGITSYEQRDALFAKIKQRKAKQPQDAWSALKEAEIALLKRKFDEAMASLKIVESAKLDDDMRSRYRQAMLRTLTAVVRSDFKQHDAEFRRLKEFAESDDEKFSLMRLTAERQQARGDYPEAFNAYRMLAKSFGERIVRRNQKGHVELTARRWAEGKLLDVWQQMSPDARKKIDAFVAEELAEAGDAIEKRLAIIRRFSFHPRAVPAMRQLAEHYAEAGNFAAAESLLSRLRSHEDHKMAAAALERLARLMGSRKLPRDAAFLYRQLASRYAQVKLPNGRTGAEHVAALKSSGRIQPPANSEVASWSNATMDVEETGTDYRSYPDQAIALSDNPYPYFRDYSFMADRSDQQLLVRRREDGELVWLVPLRAKNSHSNSTYVFSETYGHNLLLLHDSVLQCLSPVDRKVLWSRPVQAYGSSYHFSYYSSSPFGQTHKALQSGNQVTSTFGIARDTGRPGGIAFANERCVGVFGRRRLEVLDAISGDLLWTMGGLTPGNSIVATTEAVFIITPGNRGTTALRISDGAPIQKAKSLELVKNAVGVAGRHLLVADVTSSSFLGLTKSSVAWKLIDPIVGSVVWERKTDSGGAYGVLQEGTIATLTRKGTLNLIEPETGRATTYDVGDAIATARSVHLFTDDETLFIAFGNGRSYSHGYGGIESIYLTGSVTAFDRQSRKKLWKRNLDSRMAMVADEFERSPVLTFMTSKYERIGNTGISKLHLWILDKRTGKVMFDRTSPTRQSFGAFSVNLKERHLEFSTYSYRLRIVAEGPRKAIQAPRPQRKPQKAIRAPRPKRQPRKAVRAKR